MDVNFDIVGWKRVSKLTPDSKTFFRIIFYSWIVWNTFRFVLTAVPFRGSVHVSMGGSLCTDKFGNLHFLCQTTHAIVSSKVYLVIRKRFSPSTAASIFRVTVFEFFSHELTCFCLNCFPFTLLTYCNTLVDVYFQTIFRPHLPFELTNRDQQLERKRAWPGWKVMLRVIFRSL